MGLAVNGTDCSILEKKRYLRRVGAFIGTRLA
jgi:hypothetical protein